MKKPANGETMASFKNVVVSLLVVAVVLVADRVLPAAGMSP